jgi:hypothetical protein
MRRTNEKGLIAATLTKAALSVVLYIGALAILLRPVAEVALGGA